MALAGGVTIDLPHRLGYMYQPGEILSPDGRCRAFDHKATGTVFGSGVGIVVLRRLADAIADGDPIRAIIKSTAINNDGASKAGYLAPSVSGQAAAVVEALGLAGVDADTIGYVECHGTGTFIGDPIEIAALTQAFSQSTDQRGFCHVGSVKTNIGHLDTAAGVVGVIKTVLALEHGFIPATLNFEAPNPAIDFDNSPFRVADRAINWPAGPSPRRAGVNSVGVGGTNAHAILQEAPAVVRAKTAAISSPEILVVSAKNAKALDDASQRLAAHIEATPSVPLADIAFSLWDSRRHFSHRRVLAVADHADAIAVLRGTDRSRAAVHTLVDQTGGSGGAVFLFPGGGAQYPGMAKQLYANEPAFRATVDEGLRYLPMATAQQIKRIWLADNEPATAEAFLQPSLQLPAILIVEVALARLWMSWGITPKALMGHSMGENAAACIAGVLSFERAVNLVHLRGELFDEIKGGGMLSVALAPAALSARLPTELDIASINGPELCVVSGAVDALERFAVALDADGIDATRIAIDIAAHSRALEPILARFRAFLDATELVAPNLPIVSNVTGTWLTASQARDPGYWVTHLRSTVQFADGLSMLAADRNRIYLEVGPSRGLTTLVKAHGAIAANQTINSLPHADEKADDRLYMLTAVARAWAAGLPVQLGQHWRHRAVRRVSLPTYPFQHKRYFIDPLVDQVATSTAATPQRLADMTDWGWRPVWKRSQPDVRLGSENEPANWLVILDDADTGNAIVQRLRAKGHSVATVRFADCFAKASADTYTVCAEQGREDYDALVRALAQSKRLPDRVVHLGLLTRHETFRPGSSFAIRNQDRGFFSLMYLSQALADANAPAPNQFTILTNGMQRVGNEPLPYPDKATVLGPALVIPREWPGTACRVVDLAAPPPNLDLMSRARTAGSTLASFVAQRLGIEHGPAPLDLLWDELFADPASEIVAYRQGRRWRRDYEKLALSTVADEATPFRQRGVYLITGGLGDIGLTIARDLAQRFKARLVLTGRSKLPERADWTDHIAQHRNDDPVSQSIQALLAIEADGGEVVYACADVTDAKAMGRVVADAKQRFGAIHGLLHASGIVKDDLIQMKQSGDVELVFAPKIVGTQVLEDALAGEHLDVVVLFSSLSSDIAPAGQVDYVAANAYLNAFAESRSLASPTRFVAVHWGVWKDVGIAARAIKPHDPTATIASQPEGPLFDQHICESNGRHVFKGHWSGQRNWLLDEHRLGTGQQIWPGTGYLEAIIQAALGVKPLSRFEIEDVAFLRALHVPHGQSRTIDVSLAPGGGSWQATIASEVVTGAGQALLCHAEATVKILTTGQTTLDIDAIRASCNVRTIADTGVAMPSAQERHLSFGPRWRVLRETYFGRDQALARLELDPAFAGDFDAGFVLHPALLDIATGFAMDLIANYDPGAGLWVPTSYGRVKVYAPLPASIWSHARLCPTAPGTGPAATNHAAFDVSICDADGSVLVEIERFAITQLNNLPQFVAALSDATGAQATKHDAQSDELPPALAKLALLVGQGIAAADGPEAMRRALSHGLPQVIISSMDFHELKRANDHIEAAPRKSASFVRPELETTFVGPQTEIETTLAQFWAELLGINTVGINDNFFDLGGHSLIAVRLFRLIKKTYAIDLPISALFEAPTIASSALMIQQRIGKGKPIATQPANAIAQTNSPLHLVPLHPGPSTGSTPIFICAGMFGNVLNLRHLALQLGQHRAVWGLQALGLFGDQAPHESFEEMARAYIAELQSIQPHGPYVLAGFSGGGLTAFEMAQQLRAKGEAIEALVLLDTPFPEALHLTTTDRIAIRLQDIHRHGLRFFGTWVYERIAYEIERVRKRQHHRDVTTEQFHDGEIEAAFYRALSRYEAKVYDGDVLLLRPALPQFYRLPSGLKLNKDRAPLREDNGWGPFITRLTVEEVTGDHDSMVLNPHVRALADHIRVAIANAQQQRLTAEKTRSAARGQSWLRGMAPKLQCAAGPLIEKKTELILAKALAEKSPSSGTTPPTTL